MVTRMRTAGFASKQTRRRRGGWEERGEDNKKLRLIRQSSMRSSDTAAVGRAPTTLRTEPEAQCKVTAAVDNRRLPLSAAWLGVRAELSPQFGRHFWDKMADTPLSRRRALSAVSLLFSRAAAELRAV